MRQALRSVASSAPPPSLHRAQTLTDEPVKSPVSAGDPRPKSANRVLPPPPIMKPELAQPGAAQAAAKPAESQITDHVIVLLDKVGQSKAGKNGQARESRQKNVPQKAAPQKAVPQQPALAPVVREAAPPVKETPPRDVQDKNLRVNGARANGVQENDARLKQLPRKKDVRGKSFFLKKIRQEQDKKLRGARSQKQKSRKTLPSSIAITVLVALTVSIAAYQTYRMWPQMFTFASNLISGARSSFGEKPAIAARVEALRYYLEVAPSNDATGQKAVLANGIGPLQAGSKYKFHFKPAEGGYLYIIALGANGALQTFLTPRPIPTSGVITNWSAAGKDFNFPDGGQWFMIQKEAETTPFTVIFSKTPIKTPAFLSSQAGRNLNENERRELMELKTRYASSAPELVAMKEGNQPYISVQSSERAANEPVIFDISIRRR
jgi:hypothetical protein